MFRDHSSIMMVAAGDVSRGIMASAVSSEAAIEVLALPVVLVSAGSSTDSEIGGKFSLEQLSNRFGGSKVADPVRSLMLRVQPACTASFIDITFIICFILFSVYILITSLHFSSTKINVNFWKHRLSIHSPGPMTRNFIAATYCVAWFTIRTWSWMGVSIMGAFGCSSLGAREERNCTDERIDILRSRTL